MRSYLKLEEMLIRHEGVKLKPYKDTVGKLTIGCGRNLTDNGITEAEARMMLMHDIEVSIISLIKYRWFIQLSDVRKDVIINMVFNMGLPRFRGFKKMIKALSIEDYDQAAIEMLDSQWADQVGKRASELAHMMISGEYPKR